MREDMFDPHDLRLIGDGGDQPILVSTDVEDVLVSYFVDGGKDLPELGETLENIALDEMPPCLQRLMGARMKFCELAKRFIGNQPHAFILSQFEIYSGV